MCRVVILRVGFLRVGFPRVGFRVGFFLPSSVSVSFLVGFLPGVSEIFFFISWLISGGIPLVSVLEKRLQIFAGRVAESGSRGGRNAEAVPLPKGARNR